MAKNYDLTIIVPCFNVEEYIELTIKSIDNIEGDYQVEVLLIDDGSTDTTISTLKMAVQNTHNLHFDFKIISDGQNRGQGARRNEGLRSAKGKYVMFLDADDLVKPYILDAVFSVLRPRMDFVIFEWEYFADETGAVSYVSNEEYGLTDELRGANCETLLKAQTYFSVNKLYLKSFLIDNAIQYGEGYLYEDYEFYVEVAQLANYVGVCHNVLYDVRVSDNSSTKSNVKSMVHRDSFLQAVRQTLAILNPRDNLSTYNVFRYIISRALIYATRRVPNRRSVKVGMVNQTMQILNAYDVDYTIPTGLAPINYYAFTKQLLQRQKASRMLFYQKLQDKGLLWSYRSVVSKRFERSIFALPSRIAHHQAKNGRTAAGGSNPDNIVAGRILFLGFDQKYMGNSKYFFDYLKKILPPSQLRYTTPDSAVPEAYRVKYKSREFYNLLQSSEFVIGESWLPLALDKVEGQTWIQLWHGTPFKKMLFDSHERSVMMTSKRHKINLRADIERWDFLLADSVPAVAKFRSSMDFPQQKILPYGYPRNEWLVKHVSDVKLITSIKAKLGIDTNKRVVLYAPTWRDYNYKKNLLALDTNYLVDLRTLRNELGDKYVIIFKGHEMEMAALAETEGVIVCGSEVDTQELLLIADHLVTDYSSILFDAVHIRLPFTLFINDYQKYDQARGVYPDMYADFTDLVVDNEQELADYIVHPRKLATDKYNNSNLAAASRSIFTWMQDSTAKLNEQS